MLNAAALMEHLQQRKEQVERALDEILPSENTEPQTLHKAMRYAVFAGGKRIRPTLVLESCVVVGGDERKAFPAACAVELIHTYSLVHDDLPCMDDDDFRRGKPTTHKVFGEANAILCGDALLTLAFEVLAERQVGVGVPAEMALKVLKAIAKGAGHLGMVAGQVVDLEEQGKEGQSCDPKTLYSIHHRKTGALINACVEAGALIGGANEAQLESLRRYGLSLGLAFQIVDDLLDVTGKTKELGKTAGKDEKQKKLAFPAVFGIEKSQELAKEAVSKAIASLDVFGGRAEVLKALAQYVLERQK